MFKKIIIASAIAISLTAVGCSSMQTSSAQQENLNLLQNKKWILTHIGATEFKTDPTAHNVPSIQFDSATQRVSGADGCNLIMGGYTIQKDKISLSQLAGSQMMCMNTMELAEKYNTALSKVVAYQVYAKTLRLLDAHGNPVLQFESAIQPR
jgi:heat shock protein HslJ